MRPGGAYYIEDLQCGRSVRADTGKNGTESNRLAMANGVTADFVEAVADRLVGARCGEPAGCATFGKAADAASGEAAGRRAEAIAGQVGWLFCGREACGLGKACKPHRH